jgi:hypothetical protein
VVRAYSYNTLNPRLVIPFHDRLINVGVLPVPGKPPKPGRADGNGTPTNGTGVELGEPFRTRPGQAVSPVLSAGDPTNPVLPNGRSPLNGTPTIPTPVNGTTPPLSPRSPRPKKEGGYYVSWPDVSNQTDGDKIKNGAALITALGAAIAQGVLDQVTLRDVLVGVFKGVYSEDEVDSWLENAQEARDEQDALSHQQALIDQETQQAKIDAGLAVNPVDQFEATRQPTGAGSNGTPAVEGE